MNSKRVVDIDYSAQVNVEFNFVAESFDLEYVSKQMGMRPTKSGFERRVLISGETETFWRVDTGKNKMIDIEDGLDKLLEVLEPRVEIINRLKKELGLEVTIVLDVHAGDGMPALGFGKRFLEFCHAVGAEFVDIDLYV